MNTDRGEPTPPDEDDIVRAHALDDPVRLITKDECIRRTNIVETEVRALLRAVDDVLKLGIGRPYRQRMKDAAERLRPFYETEKEKGQQ